LAIKQIDGVIKAGAVCSLAGTCILVLLVLVIIIFPVHKSCVNKSECEYFSTAPAILRNVVSPQTLVISLLTIAAGIMMFRFGTWYKLRAQNVDSSP